jgi:hypothetical protein
MHRPSAAAPNRIVRRFILATALVVGLATALALRTPPLRAQEPAAPAVTAPKPAAKSVTLSDGHGAEIKIETGDNARTGAPAETAPGTSAGAAPADGAAGEATPPPGTKAHKRARVIIGAAGAEHELGSLGEFADGKPASEYTGMVVAIVFVVFFAPVCAIAIIVWYRMRKARMLNETMLKLAEKGVVPPAEALDALTGGKPPAAMAPYYDQARQVRRHAAWSDLRKGVLLAGFGLALSVYSLLEDREANGLGLVLLFVGLGFVVLWWFEQRHLVPSPPATPDSAPGAGPGPGNSPPA